MTGPTHQLIGTATGLAACQATGQHLLVTAAVAGAAGLASRLPDTLECNGLVPHRTATHTILIPPALLATVVALAIWAGPIYTLAAAGIATGYIAHLAADACTVRGLPGWPVRNRIWLLPKPVRVRTGSGRESLVAFIILAGLLADLYLQVRR